MLLITQGKGYVRTVDGETAHVGAGDVVYCPAREEHWHGAAPDRFMTHIAMWEAAQAGPETEWGDQVSDAEYLEADQ